MMILRVLVVVTCLSAAIASPISGRWRPLAFTALHTSLSPYAVPLRCKASPRAIAWNGGSIHGGLLHLTSLSSAADVGNSFVDALPALLQPSAVFTASNAFVLPFWALMVIAPGAQVTEKLMRSVTPFIVLGLLYLWLAVISSTFPEAVEGLGQGAGQLPVLTKAFSLEPVVATGWVHFLAEDLFVGRWVYLDGRKNDVPIRHSCLLSLLFGPLGVVSHLVTRDIVRRLREAKDGATGEPAVEDVLLKGSR